MAGPDLSHIVEPLRGLAVDIAKLALDPKNARVHDRRNVDAVKASLLRFGQRLPVIVQRQGMIVKAGNCRVQAATELGWKHVAAIVCDDVDDVASAFALVDNQTATLADWDDAKVAELVMSITDSISVADLKALGFDAGDLKRLQELADDPWHEVEELEIQPKPPPEFSWIVLAIPTERYFDVAPLVEIASAIPGAYVRSSVGSAPETDATKTEPRP